MLIPVWLILVRLARQKKSCLQLFCLCRKKNELSTYDIQRNFKCLNSLVEQTHYKTSTLHFAHPCPYNKGSLGGLGGSSFGSSASYPNLSPSSPYMLYPSRGQQTTTTRLLDEMTTSSSRTLTTTCTSRRTTKTTKTKRKKRHRQQQQQQQHVHHPSFEVYKSRSSLGFKAELRS